MCSLSFIINVYIIYGCYVTVKKKKKPFLLGPDVGLFTTFYDINIIIIIRVIGYTKI